MIKLYREEPPRSLAELAVKYRLDADGLLLKDLVAGRDFLAQRLGVPNHLLQVLSWEAGSIVITYWILRSLLPLAELALCRENVRKELTQHGVTDVYLDDHPSEHFGPVSYRESSMHGLCQCVYYSIYNLPSSSLQVDLALQTVHCKETYNFSSCIYTLSLHDDHLHGSIHSSIPALCNCTFPCACICYSFYAYMHLYMHLYL